MKPSSSNTAASLPIQFSTGQIVATPGALRLLEQHRILPSQLLERHIRADFGVVPPEDAEVNRAAIEHADGRILSSYPVGDDRVWIITEWDRSLTTLLLPDEY